MPVLIDTSLILRAIADQLRGSTYQPPGFDAPIGIAIKMLHPKSAADFSTGGLVVVLTDVASAIPQGYGRVAQSSFQATTWGTEQSAVRHVSDRLAVTLASIGCSLCMPGQSMTGNLKVTSIGGTAFNDENGLFYRAVRFSGWFGGRDV
jgi:hypothetical protein